MFDPLKTTTKDYIFLVVTHECNKNCPFCVDLKRGKMEYIRLNDVNKAIRHCLNNNKKTITIVGGEPTLHPKIVEISKMINNNGLELIITTNYTMPKIVKELDKYIDSFNISHYDQIELPSQKDFTADLTISKLIFKGQLDNKIDLDNFIDKYENDYYLKFSTLTICNDFTRTNSDVSDFLNNLNIDKKVLVMGQIEGHYYRGHLIKRFDIVCDGCYQPSIKMHTNGVLSEGW